MTARRVWTFVLLSWTFAVTLARAIRRPNDFAKAHWLLDYRFGLIRRSLVGSVVSAGTALFHTRPGEALILLLSAVSLLLLIVSLVVVSVRLLQRSQWSPAATLTVLAFLSSPFVVMSAHLIGYLDQIVIVLTVAALGLLLHERPGAAGILQALAVLVHENALFIGVPVFALAWLLAREQQSSNAQPLFPIRTLLPVAAALVVVVASQLVVPSDFTPRFTSHLKTFDFVSQQRASRIPVWLTNSSSENPAPAESLSPADPAVLGLVLPSLLLTLWFGAAHYPRRHLSVSFWWVAVVALIPQLIHVVAWDVQRIWTYSLATAFLALWVYAEYAPYRGPLSFAMMIFGVIAIATNVVGAMPLMDYREDRLRLATRLLLYSPVLITSLMLARATHARAIGSRAPTESQSSQAPRD